MTKPEIINVGKISGVFGIKGWVKVFSFTDPR
ncbi:MAG: ribosome maturation factor RimM, partial [Methylobacter sp.]